MSFPELPRLVQSLISIWTLIVLLMFLYNFVRYLQIGRSPALMVFTGAMLLLSLLLYQYHCYGLKLQPWQVPLVPTWLSVPMARPSLLFVPLAGLTVIATLQQYRLGRWLRSNLSAMSVKEAFDRLPTGLCYAKENGLPILVNREMDRLCRELTGGPLRDAEQFRTLLDEGCLPGALRGAPSPVLELADGRVYNVQQYKICIEGEALHELIAFDATELWRLTASLEEKEKQARLVNTRLKALLGTIEYVTMSRELLQLKTALHSRIGENLLLTKRYLLSPGSVDREELLRQWRQNLSSLLSGGSEPWQAPYFVVSREAALLGIELHINGELPQAGTFLDLAELAIQTHVTNVLRHAGGSVAEVKSEHAEDGWSLTFTNNGEPPKGVVRETGGLADLRRRVEAAGGTLVIESAPRFRMTLTLPDAKDSSDTV